MRFLFGMLVGAAIVLGAAFAHDTGMIKFGPVQALVNWDAVLTLLPK